MQIVYALEAPPRSFTKSIFLAGPSPREDHHDNWREIALEMLGEKGYQGVVFVPLPRDGAWTLEYNDQVEWETQCLNMADVILFWVPRDMDTLPGLTTNVEFGMWVDSGKCILGAPTSAVKMRYLYHHAQKAHVPMFNTLRQSVDAAMELFGNGAERIGGSREVPLHIWKLPHFQNWYQAQTFAGNRLDGAKLLWSFRVGPKGAFTFAYALHVNVFIRSEGRNKINEFIFARPDIATIVAYRLGEINEYPSPEGPLTNNDLVDHIRNTRVALIREFRSPARTEDGFIREVPGGSSWKLGEDPFVTMTHELEEETGLGKGSGFEIDPSRLRKIGSKQLAGTLSVHQAHVFACELTQEEMAYLKKQEEENVAHGVEADSERTYVEIHKLEALISGAVDVDWSMLGMILAALL